MKLTTVSIRRFRSIEDEIMDQCGPFNVLIGKNNSGKSNVLSAISAFYTCVDANVVSLRPPHGREIDFFGKNTDRPIEIRLRMQLSDSETAKLKEDIIDEAPQMKNAVEGLESSMSIDVTLDIVPPPPAFAVVSKLALVSNLGAAEQVLLSVSNQSALELRDKAAASQRASREADLMRRARIDEEMWSFQRTRGGREAWRYFVRSGPGEISPETGNTLENLLRESTSFDEFHKGMQTLVREKLEEAQSISNQRLKNKVRTFAGDESSVPNYASHLLQLIADTKVLYLRETRKQIGKDEANQILSLKIQRGGNESLRRIQETVESLLGVKIDAFQESALQRGDPEAELDVDNFLVEVNGSGVREALRLILDVEFEHPSVLMVEEPETHLHPALEISMMQYLKRVSTDVQVFVTTHSTNFLDTAEMKNVYLVSKDSSTKIQRLNYDEAESQIPKELGLRLSSLFMFDRLVFVEGPSDEAVFREWASTLRMNFSQANVGFVSMGGVRNFTHYAAEATLAFLTKRQVGIWFVIDRDEQTDQEVASLRDLFGGRAQVKVLSRRELENYMISPRLIRDFISAKRELGERNADPLPTEEDISEELQTAAEALKQLAIDKRVVKALCKPAYPSHKKIFAPTSADAITVRVSEELERVVNELQSAKTRLPDELTAQTEIVNRSWEADKFALVPGDMLLDLVCQKYGVRFKKERDSARMAALMTEGEIDRSVKEIIREIGAASA